MAWPLLFLIRHGETDWNAQGRYQGQTDIPLNGRGRAQARAQGPRLAAELSRRGLGLQDVDWLSSPLSRAAETMALLRDSLGLGPEGVRADARLMEASYGRWEGLTVPEIRQIDPEGLAARAADPIGSAPPGGESYAAVLVRALACFGACARPTVVVSHGGLSRTFRGHVLGLDGHGAMALATPQDRLHVVEGATVTEV